MEGHNCFGPDTDTDITCFLLTALDMQLAGGRWSKRPAIFMTWLPHDIYRGLQKKKENRRQCFSCNFPIKSVFFYLPKCICLLSLFPDWYFSGLLDLWISMPHNSTFFPDHLWDIHFCVFLFLSRVGVKGGIHSTRRSGTIQCNVSRYYQQMLLQWQAHGPERWLLKCVLMCIKFLWVHLIIGFLSLRSILISSMQLFDHRCEVCRQTTIHIML